ncbi:MAG TPA: stage II sporulation protein M [Gemmatimonadales bacterium]
MPALQSGPRDLRQHLEVETPEHVVLDYEIAGLGSRAAAALLDFVILGGVGLAGGLLIALMARAGFSPGRLGGAVIVMVAFAGWYGYFTFFEGLRNGQTPGKRALGIRVVADTGHAVSLGSAAVRNLLRIADFLPPPYLAGAVLVALHPRGKRIGDLAAGTIVVRDRPEERPALARPRGGEPALAAPLLDEDEFRLLSGFAARAGDLPPAARDRLARNLAARLDAAIVSADVGAGDPAESLLALHAAELERRRGALGTRGAARGGLAEQLEAAQRDRWAEFEVLVRRAAAGGLESLAPAELPDFAARYREIAADLARLRTYRAAPDVVRRVERLVAAGHNALYRGDGHRLGTVGRVLAFECPGAVVAARRYVLAAFLAFMIPGTVGYRLVRERPEVAAEVLPDVLLERAEVGVERSAAGEGFVEIDAGGRPLAASGIIANNVRVAFYCFAGGAFLGIGSLVLLAFNGLQLGATAGHFTNAGLFGYLSQFVLGHGALELFAIWVAGAAGFLLGTAIIAPGPLTRSDALVLAGRRAIRMVGAAVTCLVVSGLIEGFVSTSELGWTGRAVASGGSLAFLAAYLAAGAVAQSRGRAAY